LGENAENRRASRLSPITLNRVCRETFDFRAVAASNSLRERLLKTPRFFFAAKPLSKILDFCTPGGRGRAHQDLIYSAERGFRR
jgi:hypothetical protein